MGNIIVNTTVLRNTNFPYMDLLNNSFMRFIGLYGEHFTVECSDLKADPDSTNINDLKILSKCSLLQNSSTLGITQEQYCENLKELLKVPNGTESINCSMGSFSTSKPIKEKYENFLLGANNKEGFESATWNGLNSDLPSYIITNMNLVYKSHTKKLNFVAFFGNPIRHMASTGWESNHIDEKSFPHFGPVSSHFNYNEDTIPKVTSQYLNKAIPHYQGKYWWMLLGEQSESKHCPGLDPESIDSRGTNSAVEYVTECRSLRAIKKDMVFPKMNSKLAKDLQKITFTIDYNASYKFYKEYVHSIKR